MAGIYLHIPFCKRACSYCDFHFVTNLNQKSAFLSALKCEIELQKNFFSAPKIISTIYFGGGTPSLLSPGEVEELLSLISKHFSVRSQPETTIECNPDDLTHEKLHGYKKAGINRLSIGIQSFFDEHLTKLNRSHNSQQAHLALNAARNAGFDNITADLMYGLPELTIKQWHHNLEQFLKYNIPHLSAYNLTIEPGTPLAHSVKKKRVHIPEDDFVLEQFNDLMDFAAQNDYEHYEISNFALPGMRSMHNSNYWNAIPFAGLGPGAHSFNGKDRFFNPGNNRLYIEELNKENSVLTKEPLTATDNLNEYIMTRLRTIEGIDLSFIEQQNGKDVAGRLIKNSRPLIARNLLTQSQNHLTLTRKGKHLADYVTAELFF